MSVSARPPEGDARVPPGGTRAAEGALSIRQDAYWRRNLRITGLLLAIWVLVTFGVAYFARELDFSFFGWPFSFWVAAQGALIVYVVIIGFYAWYMGRLGREHGADEDD